MKISKESELINRLLECESVVTEYGEWDYDLVPGDLVSDILDYLWDKMEETDG